MELSILGNYQQTSKQIMKNQGENKNRNNTFHFLEFIHFTADLIGPFSYLTEQHFMKFWKDKVLKNLRKLI